MVVPTEDSVITEMTSTLRDWGALWKQLYVVGVSPRPALGGESSEMSGWGAWTNTRASAGAPAPPGPGHSAGWSSRGPRAPEQGSDGCFHRRRNRPDPLSAVHSSSMFYVQRVASSQQILREK